MEQQNINLIKQIKSIPTELLVDILKTSTISLNDLNICKRKYELTIEMELKQLKKYWHKFAQNILTSSGVIYFFIGENFKRMLKFIMEGPKEPNVEEVTSGGQITEFLDLLSQPDAKTLLTKILSNMEKESKLNAQILSHLAKQTKMNGDMINVLAKSNADNSKIINLLTTSNEDNSALVHDLRLFINKEPIRKVRLPRTPTKDTTCLDCDRTFSSPGSLSTHLLTEKHKRNLEKQRKVSDIGDGGLGGSSDPILEGVEAKKPKLDSEVGEAGSSSSEKNK
ncbi:hypothetical protein Mgra_00007995 [Meloidogyne graminicola]|uniref:C2H2-type domain-containing protein n=1 Tax=Meloidogyne graminicola TaxID=189291 RepID=A0A8S9ZH13_9BILA|nr:hypothetical protein Mgra_00007995 [Meloidogyne graminicola]